MIRSALYVLAGLGVLCSCSYDWRKLDPTHLEPTLVNDNKPILRALDDGRDISGYPIPVTKKAAYTESADKSVPVGTQADRANVVISPYSPHKMLDSTGMKSGDLVRDPDSMKVFRLP